jgi:hypothetical protein
MLRASIFIFYSAGFGILFYGTAIFVAALTTYRRRLRSPEAPAFQTLAQELLYYQDVARQGIYYGLSIASAGFAFMVIGRLIQRFRRRQLIIEARRRDVEAFNNRQVKL